MNQEQQLDAFLALLQKWNKAYNLTAIRDLDTMRTHHILDSLSLNDYLVGDQVLDVGTGAGLPGIPLAIMNPEKHFTLLDSNGKKARFCQQAVMELGLKNVTVVHGRIEDESGSRFTTITSRAFSSLAQFYGSTQDLLAENGVLLAMKGKVPQEELEEMPEGVSVGVHQLLVPEIDAERCLVVLKGKSRG